MRRNTPRIDGVRNELTLAQQDVVLLCDAHGRSLHAFEVPDLIDFATTDAHIMLFALRDIYLFSRITGLQLAHKGGEYLDPAGLAQQSSTCPNIVVWPSIDHQAIKFTESDISVSKAPVEGTWVLPLSDTRWLHWEHSRAGGQLRLWRTIGDAWKIRVGDPNSSNMTGQLVLDGRLLVLLQTAGSVIRLFVVAMNDGSVLTNMRLENVRDIRVAAKRGYAVIRMGDDLKVIDLRFGKIARDLYLPREVDDFAMDANVQRIALLRGPGVVIVNADSLSEAARRQSELEQTDIVEAIASDNPLDPEDDPPDTSPGDLAMGSSASDFPDIAIEDVFAVDRPFAATLPSELPSEPLIALVPLEPVPLATDAERAAELDCALDLVGAAFGRAFAQAWDTGTLSRNTDDTHLYEIQIAGLLHSQAQLAPSHVADAFWRFADAFVANKEMRISLEGRYTPLQLLRREFGLSELAVTLIVTIGALYIRNGHQQLVRCLKNDMHFDGFDEALLLSLFDDDAKVAVARELDPDMPLCKYGIVRLDKAEARPYETLTVDPMIIRYISGQHIDGERSPHLTIRTADRNLEELQLPPEIVHRALTELALPSPVAVRIAVRGRAGCGRHTFLAALASRAGRDLGMIDVTAMERGAVLADQLRTALQRCQLRGAIACIDGLQSSISDEDPDTKLSVTRVMREHPGPLAIRLLPEAQIPLDPGYLLYDIRSRTEVERGESWRESISRHGVDLSDASDLAARYRVGPGVVERVVRDVAQRSNAPTTPEGWSKAFDESVRQYLENKLGKNANRVTRLANWADIVLPDDIIKSLTELTSRVRHRKRVYETWGFDKSITSARGITALFSGTPGTGKTMVAGVIARDLGLDVYRVDVSRITSKWIGETEKNLGSLFDAAEDGQVMLLFDEADSLFGKRTEVKSSVDRYANMETNYLLQRLDTFEGIAILTTNFGTAIDPAFKRRLTYRMTFPFPDEEMREKLWATMIPDKAPVRGPLDFKSLAQRFRLSGGYIRNAVLRAAFLAVEDSGVICQKHLEQAVRMEFREIGKLTDSGTLE